MSLYPLKFKPILKERIWGGSYLCEKEVEEYHLRDGIGESWDIAGMPSDNTVVINGPLKGNTLSELIEIYMGDLVGDAVYEKFGTLFPLIAKYIDTTDRLSVQVHPNDKLARERHESYGKSEMWYIVDCCEGAYLYLGLKEGTTEKEYEAALKAKKLEELLNKVEVKKGDLFFVPAGAIHSLGAGILAVEVHQPSDITYRIFDWDRKDSNGKARELHIPLALDAIDFDYRFTGIIKTKSRRNESVIIEENKYFTAAEIDLDGSYTAELEQRDSFTIYTCVEGSSYITFGDGYETLDLGEMILIPNEMDTVTLTGKGKILEFYIKTENI